MDTLDVLMEKLGNEGRNINPVKTFPTKKSFSKREKRSSAYEGLENIASLAYQKLTKKVVRTFSESSDKYQSIRNYVSKFTEELHLTQNQVENIVKIFIGYIKETISEKKERKKLIGEINAYNSKERMERINFTYKEIISYISERGKIPSKGNPLKTLNGVAEIIYKKSNFPIHKGEIEMIAKSVLKRTSHDSKKNILVSLESRLGQYKI